MLLARPHGLYGKQRRCRADLKRNHAVRQYIPMVFMDNCYYP